MSTKKFSKRAALRSETIPSGGLSQSLREVSLTIARGDQIAALGMLEKIAGTAMEKGSVAKILALTADSQMALGRYAEATDLYARSREEFQRDSDPDWFRASVGEIRASLKALAFQRAHGVAASASMKLISDKSLFDQSIEKQGKDSTGVLAVDARGVRPVAGIARLGAIFLEEGHVDAAEDLFGKAIALSPLGAIRAKQGMAKVSLLKGLPAEAEEYARESLINGKFAANTISSWRLLLEARRKLGVQLLDDSLFQSLCDKKGGSVFARSVLEIVVSLRSYGDEKWKEIAERWRSTKKGVDPVVDTEIGKLLLAEAKLSGGPPGMVVSIAAEILGSSLVSPSESIGAAKSTAAYLLQNGGTREDLGRLASRVHDKFGADTSAKAIHAMGLASMLAKKHDVARALLVDLISRIPSGSTQWGKSVWALARMEAALQRHGKSAEWYLIVAGHSETPIRFRIQGLLHWVGQLRLSGESPDLGDIRRRLDPALELATDFHLLLDAARQLTLAGDEFRELAEVVAEKGTKEALSALGSASTHTESLGILIVLARRLFYDFAKPSQLLSIWEKLAQSKRESLWSADSRFWEIIGLIHRSYEAVGRVDAGDQLITEMLGNTGLPNVGVVHLSSVFGDSLVRRGRFEEGMKLFARGIDISPSHELSAAGYYWSALAARKKGNLQEMAAKAAAIRKCFSGKPAMHWQWVLDSRAIIFLAEVGSSAGTGSHVYSDEFMKVQESGLTYDMSIIP